MADILVPAADGDWQVFATAIFDMREKAQKAALSPIGKVDKLVTWADNNILIIATHAPHGGIGQKGWDVLTLQGCKKHEAAAVHIEVAPYDRQVLGLQREFGRLLPLDRECP